ncbi:MAG: VacJ family lipoprotein [Burkholderiales bacterium]|jgi:ABC-type transporter lipoprotein component MlaA
MLCSGCATGPNPKDPFESANRKVYAFNKSVDNAVLKPVAKGYVKILPSPARGAISNFFRNLGVVVTLFNDVLQLKVKEVPVDIMRFSTNLVFGMGGLIDIATYARIPYNQEDFGQTLGYWGFNSGPYLVLPFFGPSDVRDGLGLPVDIYVSPIYDTIGDEGVRWGLLALYVVDTRANLFTAESFVQLAALDEYSFVRDTYLQRREYLVRDGKVTNLDKETKEQKPKSLRELELEDFGDEPLQQGEPPPQDAQPKDNEPKSLLELEQEEFGDEPVMGEPPPQDAQPKNSQPKSLLELEREEFGDEPVMGEPPPQ